jgi:hypothetical protein
VRVLEDEGRVLGTRSQAASIRLRAPDSAAFR